MKTGDVFLDIDGNMCLRVDGDIFVGSAGYINISTHAYIGITGAFMYPPTGANTQRQITDDDVLFNMFEMMDNLKVEVLKRK